MAVHTEIEEIADISPYRGHKADESRGRGHRISADVHEEAA
jgi:hypothetical protein